MIGKGSILIVFGFMLSFSSFQVRMNNNVLSTSTNFNRIYTAKLVHETALSTMNLAINKIWDQNISSDSFTVITNNCSSKAVVSAIGIDTVKISVDSWNYYYTDGSQKAVKESRSITAWFRSNTPLSKYFWFSQDENNYDWKSGDSVRGPTHTNGILKTNGTPVFHSKTTAKLGISPDPTTSSAEFLGGWEIGVSNNMPADMSSIIAAANWGNGTATMNSKCLYDLPVTFDFQADGSVIRTVSGNPPDTILLSNIAPTGAVYSTADLRVKGVFNGQITILSAGNIWIDDDLIYADDPETNPNSDDLLGLVSQNNIYITDNVPNQSNIHIQASLVAVQGSFTAENYHSRPISGDLKFTGSIAQSMRGAVCTIEDGSVETGFNKHYRYDSRLNSLSPPHFPYINSLSLLNWWE